MSNEREIRIPVDDISLEAILGIPEEPMGIVLFAHGSGSSSRSPRNAFVARELRASHLGTLLMDLLTPAEALDAANRFDIVFLARRLQRVLDWVGTQDATAGLPVGLFGASTGAAAALQVAASAPKRVAAVVSRGGRPDLAGELSLSRVRAPTLLIVGGDDREVLALNKAALALLRGPRELSVVPGASHLFEEPGTLEAVARLSSDWFARHLGDAWASTKERAAK
jgi:putative phosphoribosyl transferase